MDIDWDTLKCRELFVLGYLHDIGYQYSENQLQHERAGGELLEKSGYRYWKEVYYHGNPDAEYESDELTILNIADMETSNAGRRISMDERLESIADRYGSGSNQYVKAKRLVAQLKAYLQNLQ